MTLTIWHLYHLATFSTHASNLFLFPSFFSFLVFTCSIRIEIIYFEYLLCFVWLKSFFRTTGYYKVIGYYGSVNLVRLNLSLVDCNLIILFRWFCGRHSNVFCAIHSLYTGYLIFVARKHLFSEIKDQSVLRCITIFIRESNFSEYK